MRTARVGSLSRQEIAWFSTSRHKQNQENKANGKIPGQTTEKGTHGVLSLGHLKRKASPYAVRVIMLGLENSPCSTKSISKS